jgi:Tfp pilus assembly protein PilN
MININLLPRELIPKQRNFIPYILIAGLAVVLFIYYGTKLTIMSLDLSTSRNTLASTEAEIGKLSDIVSQVEQLELEKHVVSKKEDAVERIMTGRTLWSHELHILANLVPEGVWLEEVKISSRKRPVTVTVPNPNRNPGQPPTVQKTVVQSFPALRMTGYALSPQREKGLSLIGEFLRNTKTDDVFSMRFISPEMRSIDRERFMGQTVMRFVMDCEIAQ